MCDRLYMVGGSVPQTLQNAWPNSVAKTKQVSQKKILSSMQENAQKLWCCLWRLECLRVVVWYDICGVSVRNACNSSFRFTQCDWLVISVTWCITQFWVVKDTQFPQQPGSYSQEWFVVVFLFVLWHSKFGGWAQHNCIVDTSTRKINTHPTPSGQSSPEHYFSVQVMAMLHPLYCIHRSVLMTRVNAQVILHFRQQTTGANVFTSRSIVACGRVGASR